jgi:hypothetical protein
MNIASPEGVAAQADAINTAPARNDDAVRVDLWLREFDGLYRFYLPQPQMNELERLCGERGIFQIYGGLTAGRYSLGDQPVNMPHEGQASARDIFETVRLGLIGGAVGLVNGERIVVTAQTASSLVDTYLRPSPLERAWNIAFAILDARINGRAATKQEIAAGGDSRTAVVPDDEAAE